MRKLAAIAAIIAALLASAPAGAQTTAIGEAASLTPAHDNNFQLGRCRMNSTGTIEKCSLSGGPQLIQVGAARPWIAIATWRMPVADQPYWLLVRKPNGRLRLLAPDITPQSGPNAWLTANRSEDDPAIIIARYSVASYKSTRGIFRTVANDFVPRFLGS